MKKKLIGAGAVQTGAGGVQTGAGPVQTGAGAVQTTNSSAVQTIANLFPLALQPMVLIKDGYSVHGAHA